MSVTKRLKLFHYDVVRERCENDHCGRERFHFVPTGDVPAAGPCRCGAEGQIRDMSDTAIGRLVTQPNGELVIVPRLQR